VPTKISTVYRKVEQRNGERKLVITRWGGFKGTHKSINKLRLTYKVDLILFAECECGELIDLKSCELTRFFKLPSAGACCAKLNWENDLYFVAGA
jgi:hypothetical protein